MAEEFLAKLRCFCNSAIFGAIPKTFLFLEPNIWDWLSKQRKKQWENQIMSVSQMTGKVGHIFKKNGKRKQVWLKSFSSKYFHIRATFLPETNFCCFSFGEQGERKGFSSPRHHRCRCPWHHPRCHCQGSCCCCCCCCWTCWSSRSFQLMIITCCVKQRRETRRKNERKNGEFLLKVEPFVFRTCGKCL